MPRGRRRDGARKVVGRRDPGPDFPPWLAMLFAGRIGRFEEAPRTLLRLARGGDPGAVRTLWVRWRCRWIVTGGHDGPGNGADGSSPEGGSA